MSKQDKGRPNKKLNKMPIPHYKKVYEIYSEHTGLKKSLQLQKRMNFSSFLILSALFSAILLLVCQNQLLLTEAATLLIISVVGAIGAYLARDAWIKKELGFSNYTGWHENQKIKAYEEVKKESDFKNVDTEKYMLGTFKKAESFLENRLNILVASVVIPVWSLFLNDLSKESLTQVLAFLIFVGCLVVYFNWMFFVLLNSYKAQYLSWLESCVELETQVSKE